MKIFACILVLIGVFAALFGFMQGAAGGAIGAALGCFIAAAVLNCLAEIRDALLRLSPDQRGRPTAAALGSAALDAN